jgi:hypothetical protein
MRSSPRHANARRSPGLGVRRWVVVAVLGIATAWLVVGGAGALAEEPPSAPIYWRQNLLTVPYQLNSQPGGATPKSVWLYVSKDRGTNWQPISDAQPQLLAFNYRAESDGEYWFAIRTSEASGREAAIANLARTQGAMQPELRVIVDTNLPRFEGLTSVWREAAKLEVRWRVVDANLAPHACNLEYQVNGSNDWQPVALASAQELTLGTWDGAATIVAVDNLRPTAVRATVTDLAGNRAVYQTAVPASADLLAGGPQLSTPTAPAIEPGQGWVASSAPAIAATDAAAEPQLWPADRLKGADAAASRPPVAINYGVPAGLESTAAPLAANTYEADEGLELPKPITEDRPLGIIPPQRAVNLALQPDPPRTEQAIVAQPPAEQPHVEPLRPDIPTTAPSPFRVASMNGAATMDGSNTDRENSAKVPQRIASPVPPPPANPLARFVNARSFSLEYELAEIGSGISKVELWGTHDGGATWRLFSVDSDNRSPLDVTVDGAGEYGFSIVVATIDGSSNSPPQSGDTPELWINVDLAPPIAQILSVNSGQQSVGGELVIAWTSEDDNLEPRPVSLFYSSRPAGPWTTIATNLEGNSHYNWPLERHVPRTLYLKLESRDTAGNVAVYQTNEPVTVESGQSLARVQRLPPVD